MLSCSKDDSAKPTLPTVFQEENPLPVFLTNSGFTDVVPMLNRSAYELGYVFKPLEFGTINSITIKLPVNPARTLITVWDKSAGAIIITARIPLLFSGEYDPNSDYVLPITPFALTKNKEYIISMNTENWFLRGRTASATNPIYPSTVGNIQFLDFVYNLGSARVMPTTPVLNLFYGDLGFKFKRI